MGGLLACTQVMRVRFPPLPPNIKDKDMDNKVFLVISDPDIVRADRFFIDSVWATKALAEERAEQLQPFPMVAKEMPVRTTLIGLKNMLGIEV